MNTKSLLKSHKLRITPFREKVLELFIHKGTAISAKYIQEEIEDSDRITVYRTIKSFVDKGIIHEAFDGTDVPKFAMCEEHCDEHAHHDSHVHFHCNKCEETFCVEEAEVPYISTPSGFQVQATNIVLQGKCSTCNSSN